jgi:hypothetical protein
MVFGPWPYPQSVLDGPADISPNGVYNFDVVPPWNNQAYAVVGVGVSITLIGALLRFYVRVFVNKRVYLDDCTQLTRPPPSAFFTPILYHLRIFIPKYTHTDFMKTDQDAIFDSDVALFALVRLPA